ncbi:MAG: hypothetical protein J6R61_00545 [Bacteroidales bacterium]|nr:hypothetical protein [Bacteroidales bacterium]
MKKVFFIALLLISLIPNATTAQSKALDKALQKEYKTKIKEFNKEGWKIFASTRSTEVALLKHYQELNNDGVTEIFGTTTSANKNIAKDKLSMSACISYAQMSGSNIKGRIVEDMGSIITTEELEEFDHFYSAYENSVKSEINGELRLSFIIYREISLNNKKTYEFTAFYIVDKESATKARMKAFKNAVKESAVAQKYAETISEFINEEI